MKTVILMAIFGFAVVACGSVSDKQHTSQTENDGSITLPDNIGRVGNTNLYIVQENDYFGVKNDIGKVIIPITQDEIIFMPPFFIINKNNTLGVVNQQGKEILSQKYQKIVVDKKLIYATNEQATAAFNHQGQRLTNFEYYDFEEHAKVFVAYHNEGKQVFNYNGDCLIPIMAKEIEIYEDSTFSMIDTSSKPEYKECFIFYQAYNNKWGVISLENRANVKPLYDEIFLYGDYYLGRKNIKYCALDMKGKVVTGFYDDIEPLDNGFIVQKDDYYGYLSKDNKLLLKIKYPMIINMGNNRLWVKKSFTQIGLYSDTGKELLPPIYEAIWEQDIEGTHVYVQYKGKIGVWNKNRFIIPILYDDIYLFLHKQYSYWSVVKDGKHGLLHRNTKTMLSPKYSSISYCMNDQKHSEIEFVVSIEDKFQKYSLAGEYIGDVNQVAYFNMDASYLVPWKDVKKDSLLYNNAHIYEVCFSSKE